jgi:hypothetical protein
MEGEEPAVDRREDTAYSSHQLCALDATASLLLQDARGLDARGRILTDLLHL